MQNWYTLRGPRCPDAEQVHFKKSSLQGCTPRWLAHYKVECIKQEMPLLPATMASGYHTPQPPAQQMVHFTPATTQPAPLGLYATAIALNRRTLW